jgi:hypothetical protein
VKRRAWALVLAGALALLVLQPGAWMMAHYGPIGLGPQPRMFGAVWTSRRTVGDVVLHGWVADNRRCWLVGDMQHDGTWQVCINWPLTG